MSAAEQRTSWIELNNGVTLPPLGFDVFQTPPDETVAAVEHGQCA